MAKKPIIRVWSIDVECPECSEFISAPSGSLYFEIGEARPGETHTCVCGYSFTFTGIKTVKVGV
jgi:hypothetical protein